MANTIHELLGRMEGEDWVGRERELLNFAKECLKLNDHTAFERFLIQGYAEVCDSPFAYEVHRLWCEILARPYTPVHEGTVNICCPGLKTSTLIPNQINELKALGWRGLDANNPLHIQLSKRDYSGSVEEALEKALDILNIPFHRGLPPPNPPVKSRYERLMDEDTLQV